MMDIGSRTMGVRHCTPIVVYDCNIHVSPYRSKTIKSISNYNAVISCGTLTILALWDDRLGEYMGQLSPVIDSDLTYCRSMNVSVPHPSLCVLVLNLEPSFKRIVM